MFQLPQRSCAEGSNTSTELNDIFWSELMSSKFNETGL